MELEPKSYRRLMAAIRLQAVRDFVRGLQLCRRRRSWVFGLLDAAIFLAFDEPQGGRIDVLQEELREALKDLSADPAVRRILLRMVEDDGPLNWNAIASGRSPYPDTIPDPKAVQKVWSRMNRAYLRATGGKRLNLHPDQKS